VQGSDDVAGSFDGIFDGALPADFDREFGKTVTPNMLVTVFFGALMI
jgi:hypothetical protein